MSESLKHCERIQQIFSCFSIERLPYENTMKLLKERKIVLAMVHETKL